VENGAASDVTANVGNVDGIGVHLLVCLWKQEKIGASRWRFTNDFRDFRALLMDKWN
jgi:hypothetical protein